MDWSIFFLFPWMAEVDENGVLWKELAYYSSEQDDDYDDHDHHEDEEQDYRDPQDW